MTSIVSWFRFSHTRHDIMVMSIQRSMSKSLSTSICLNDGKFVIYADANARKKTIYQTTKEVTITPTLLTGTRKIPQFEQIDAVLSCKNGALCENSQRKTWFFDVHAMGPGKFGLRQVFLAIHSSQALLCTMFSFFFLFRIANNKS